MFDGKYMLTRLEECVLKTLDWNLNQITTHRFLSALLAQGVVLSTDECKNVEKVAQVAEYLEEVSLLVMPLMNYPASVVAWACVYVARSLLKVNPVWNEELEIITCYKFEDMEDCIDLLIINLESLRLGGKKITTSAIFGQIPLNSSALNNDIKIDYSLPPRPCNKNDQKSPKNTKSCHMPSQIPNLPLEIPQNHTWKLSQKPPMPKIPKSFK
jgi:hypothetical protein